MPSTEPPPHGYNADPSAGPIGRDKRERKFLTALDRRIAHVEERAARGPTGASYDYLEAAALRWALSRIADAERAEESADAAPHADC